MDGQDNTSHKTDESQAQPPLPPPLPPDDAKVLSGTEGNPSDKPETETEKLLRGTRTIEWLQFGANAALAVIGVIALCIYGFQLTEMERQGNLIRQQLTGTQAALVAINGPVGIQLLGNKFNISIGFRNDGHVIAHSVDGAMVVQLWNVAESKSTKTIKRCPFSIPTITPSELDHPYRQCFVDGVADEELKAIHDLRDTVTLDGTYTYDDGFGRIIPVPFCFRWIPQVQTSRGLEGDNDKLADCGLFDEEREKILRNMREK